MQTTATDTALGTDTGTGVGTTADIHVRIVGRADSNSTSPGPELMTAGVLEGDHTISLNGGDLGKITGIMLDVRRGRIIYVMMSVGGFLDVGDKLFAVPWSAVSLDVDRKYSVLDTNKDRLETAPGSSKDS